VRARNTRPRPASKRTAPARRAREPTAHVNVRLARSYVARIEALRPRYSRPWHKATRSDVLRVLILRGLDAIEEQQQSAR